MSGSNNMTKTIVNEKGLKFDVVPKGIFCPKCEYVNFYSGPCQNCSPPEKDLEDMDWEKDADEHFEEFMIGVPEHLNDNDEENIDMFLDRYL